MQSRDPLLIAIARYLNGRILLVMQIDTEQQEERQPYQVRVPFVTRQMGLGDLVAQATKAIGVRPCGGCQKRQEKLNRAVQLNPYRG